VQDVLHMKQEGYLSGHDGLWTEGPEFHTLYGLAISLIRAKCLPARSVGNAVRIFTSECKDGGSVKLTVHLYLKSS
jgi:hypothetical protein